MVRTRLLKRLAFSLPLLVLLAIPEPGGAAPPVRTSLIFAGSGTTLPLVRLLAREFQKKHPDVDIQVPASIGSTSGIRAAADGAIAIGLISRPLKESEQRLGLETVPFARTPVVIGVHPGVAEENVTTTELLDIYRGRKAVWQSGREIVVLTREPGDSTIEALEQSVPGFREAYAESQQAKRWTTLLKDLEMNIALAKTPQAIGFSDLGAIAIERHRIKPLRLNGVAPTLANLQQGKYRLAKPLVFVFRRGKLPPAAREFIAFVRSPAGAKLMRANGYLPE